MDKFNRNTWVKVPESDSAPVPSCPKCRADDASLLKLKGGRWASRNGQERHFLMPERVTTIGKWNVRTLDTVRETSLLMHELCHFRWDVIGLAKTHWTRKQELVVNGCKIVSSGGGKIHSRCSFSSIQFGQKMHAQVQTYKWLNDISQISDNDTSSHYHVGICTNSSRWRWCHQKFPHGCTEWDQQGV